MSDDIEKGTTGSSLDDFLKEDGIYEETKALKHFPRLLTDEAAEDFVANADLTEFDWSDMKPVKFELRPKDE